MASAEVALRDGNYSGDMLLPPGQLATTALLHQAPVDNGRSFLVGETFRPVDPSRMVPTVEALPGVFMPMPIIPNVGTGKRWDFDHVWFQGNDPRLQGIAGRALRHSLGQLVPRPTHELKNERFDAIHIPTDPDLVFQTVLFGLMKYVPRHMVDLSGDRTVIREANGTLREAVRGHISIEPKTQWKIGYYMAQFVLAHGLDAIRTTHEVNSFLEAKDERARRIASFGVVRRAIDVVVDSFEPTYEKARKAGAVLQPDPTAASFVERFFNRHQPDYVPTIAQAILPQVA